MTQPDGQRLLTRDSSLSRGLCEHERDEVGQFGGWCDTLERREPPRIEDASAARRVGDPSSKPVANLQDTTPKPSIAWLL